MSNQAKVLRKQLRNTVQEILPELIKEELYREVEKRVNERVAEIAKYMKEVLGKIDERSKDVQGYLVRQTSTPQPAAPKSDNKTE